MRTLVTFALCAVVLMACVRPVALPKAQQIQVAPIAVAAVGADSLGDVLFPKLGNGGYDVEHYAIDLDVDVTRNIISATVTVTARATQPLAQFNFDFSGLNIRSIEVNNTPAQFSRQNTELIIQPGLPLNQDALFKTTIRYDGSPSGVDDPSVDFSKIGWLTQTDGIYVVSEPSGAMSWFPNNNHPRDKASYTLRVRVPKPYVAAANGLLREVIDNDNSRTYVWETTQPMASYLATLHINQFEVQTETGPHGLPIRNYFPKGTAQSVKNKFSKTNDMIVFMEQRIAPYPFAAYGVVLLTERVPWALETQSLSTFGAEGADEVVVFHELMHQWYGNSVSPAQWRDIWLNEGFATYFQFLWDTRATGKDALRVAMNEWYDWMEDARTGPPIPAKPGEMFGSAVYYRGAYTLFALHMTVGDDAFYKIMRTYYERYKNSNASTEDFIKVAEEISGKPARELLSAWLFQRGLPPKI